MQEFSRDPSAAVDWEKLRPVLDIAINELGENERDAVVLRFFEARRFADIGATLLVTEDAARMRVERALEKLRTALARRGVTSTSTALAAVLHYFWKVKLDATYPIYYGIGVAVLLGIRLRRNYRPKPAS